MFRKLLLASSAVAVLSATNTTMCFKKNHLDPSTIETMKLEGGECEGKYTVEDMQRLGYRVHDIKISSGEEGLNYIYIFQKGQPQVTQTTLDGKYILSKEELRAKFEEIQEEQRVEKEEKQRVANIGAGRNFYVEHCQKCHGEKGEVSAYGASRPLANLTFDQISLAILDYDLGKKSSSTAVIMNPYANMLTDDKIANIVSYLQSLKQPK